MQPDSNNNVYSGLYAYEINTNRWKLLRSDVHGNTALLEGPGGVNLKSRIGHSMLFDQDARILYIFAGQRNKDYLSDFYAYDLNTDTMVELSRDYSKQGGPEPGFTQRATIDTQAGEIYVLSGILRDKAPGSQDSVKNALWVYNIPNERWTRIYTNDRTSESTESSPTSETADLSFGLSPRSGNADNLPNEPIPRFAHQLIYDSKTKAHYLFGGNPGDASNPTLRLDDFWELRLSRPMPSSVVRQAKFFIRKQAFLEMCRLPPSSDPLSPLRYLQNDVAAAVDHSNPTESAEFRSLTSWLFQSKENGSIGENQPLFGGLVGQPHGEDDVG